MNYLELQTAVADRIHRSDLTSDIQQFLEIAHSRLQVDIDNPENYKYAAIADTAFTEIPDKDIWTAALPVDCLRVTGVTVNGYYLTSTTPAQLEARGHDRSAARSYFYSIVGMDIWTAPGAGNVGLYYYGRTPFFTSDTDTNNLSIYFPQLYIYGAIVEAQHFTQDVEELQKATSLYDTEMARVNKQLNRLVGGPAVMAV